jgi:hypothetical protein
MRCRSPDLELGLRVRLTWVGCQVKRTPERSVELRSLDASLLGRLIGRTRAFALLPWGREEVRWPELAMELAGWLWPAPPPASPGVDRPVGGGAAMQWGTAEAGATAAPPVLPDVIREFMAAAAPQLAMMAPPGPGGAGAQRQRDLPPVMIRPFAPARGAMMLASHPVVVPGDPRRRGQVDRTTPPRQPTGPVAAALAPRSTFLFSASAIQRELPSAASGAVATLSPEPSLVDHLFSMPDRPAPPEGLIFRVLPVSPAPVAEQAAAASPPGGWSASGFQTGRSPEPRAHFTRAELDLLTAKVLTLIKRQERLERESKGLL